MQNYYRQTILQNLVTTQANGSSVLLRGLWVEYKVCPFIGNYGCVWWMDVVYESS